MQEEEEKKIEGEEEVAMDTEATEESADVAEETPTDEAVA